MNLKNLNFHCFLVGWIAVFLLLPHLNFAQIEVIGPVEGNWSLEESPVIVTGNIVITRGTTLQIQPGVKVVFREYGRLTVEGRLLAVGGDKPEDNIVFTSIRDATMLQYRRIERPDDRAAIPGQEWDVILFERQEPDMMSQMENVVIRYSREGIRCRYAYPKLRNIFIERTAVEEMLFTDQRVKIKDGEYSDYYTAELGLRCEISVVDKRVYNQDQLEVNLSITNVSDRNFFQIQIPHVSVTDRQKAEIEFISGAEEMIQLNAGEQRNLTRTYRINSRDETEIKLEYFVYTFERGEAYTSNYAISDSIKVYPYIKPELEVAPKLEKEVAQKIPQISQEIPQIKKSKPKWLYYVIPAAIVGGVAVYFGLRGKGTSTSTIVISMPVDY